MGKNEPKPTSVASDALPEDETVKKPPKNGKLKNVLVVGDWLVDEHWVAGIHRSATSSRTGQVHYRSLHGIDSIVQSFCGAGTPASLLYHAHKNSERPEKPGFFVYGMGLWHQDDTEMLEDMFDYEKMKNGNMFRMYHAKNNIRPENVKLINLYGPLSEVDKQPNHNKREICTTRIIRIYHSVHPDDFKFLRMDWELRPINLKEEDVAEAVKQNIFPLLNNPEKKMDAVIIKDLTKGVISPPLIRKLAEIYPDARWYVSSKAWLPPWFEELKRVKKLRLLMIPQVAAQQAVRDGFIHNWITRAGYPGEMVFSGIESVLKKIGDHHHALKIIVLPKNYSAIALTNPKFSNGAEPDCFIQTLENPKPSPPPLGMASIFLPAAVAWDFSHHEHTNVNDPNTLKNMLETSLKLTYRWSKTEGQRFQNPANWITDKNFYVDQFQPDEDSHFTFKSFNWQLEKEIWKQAATGIGVINVKLKKPSGDSANTIVRYIELWRSMIEVDGYVCFVEEKRSEIRKIIKGIGNFLKGEKKHPIGCLLAANPGSGKTTLVKRLAQSMNLRFLPFNITQMSSRADLQDCFDTIVTTQAQNRYQPILVFIDEINAKLDNSHVYDAFLAPLEEGVYVKGGKAFHIDPCIWIFAGTEDPSHEENDPQRKSEKKSDFVSRLELGVIDLRKQADVFRRQLEYVYMGVSLLINEYPDVRYISEKVLKVFEDMPAHVCVRDIKHFIKSFNNIQYGEVNAKNVPIDKLREIKDFDHKKWEEKDYDGRVEIATLPSRESILDVIDYSKVIVSEKITP